MKAFTCLGLLLTYVAITSAQSQEWCQCTFSEISPDSVKPNVFNQQAVVLAGLAQQQERVFGEGFESLT